MQNMQAAAVLVILAMLPACCEKRTCGPKDLDRALRTLVGDDAVDCRGLDTDDMKACIAAAEEGEMTFVVARTLLDGATEHLEQILAKRSDGTSVAIEFYSSDDAGSHVSWNDCLVETRDAQGTPVCAERIGRPNYACSGETCQTIGD